MPKIEEMNNIECWLAREETVILWKIVQKFLLTLTIYLPYNLLNLLLDIYSEKMKTYAHENEYILNDSIDTKVLNYQN